MQHLSLRNLALATALATCCWTAPVFANEPTPATQPAVATFPIADVIAEVKTEPAAAQSATGADLGISLQKVALNFALPQRRTRMAR